MTSHEPLSADGDADVSLRLVLQVRERGAYDAKLLPVRIASLQCSNDVANALKFKFQTALRLLRFALHCRSTSVRVARLSRGLSKLIAHAFKLRERQSGATLLPVGAEEPSALNVSAVRPTPSVHNIA